MNVSKLIVLAALVYLSLPSSSAQRSLHENTNSMSKCCSPEDVSADKCLETIKIHSIKQPGQVNEQKKSILPFGFHSSAKNERNDSRFIGLSIVRRKALSKKIKIIIECLAESRIEKRRDTKADSTEGRRSSMGKIDTKDAEEGSRSLKGIKNTELGSVVFWGAETYMSTNIAHVFLCIVVVVTYFSVPGLGKSLYNRAVLCHNVSLLMLGVILTLLGYCDLRECPGIVKDNPTILLWLLLQYWTIATVFWLNVICLDVTLSITRFRWMVVRAGKVVDRDDHRRSILYNVFAWGGALIPTLVAAFFEYCPGIPEDLPFKPNYLRYRMGPNPTVNLYFFLVPLFTLFWNNVLFVFTTYRILVIIRSTKMATSNQENVMRKKYLIFLRLYLLIGAPWFFGCLLACLNKLIILKICRLIQPILWLLLLVPCKKLQVELNKVINYFFIREEQRGTTTTI